MPFCEFNGRCSVSTSSGQCQTRSVDKDGKKKVILIADGDQIYEFNGESNANVVSTSSSNLPACETDSRSSAHEVTESGSVRCKERTDLKTPPRYGPLLLTFINFIFYNISLAFVFVYKYYWIEPEVIWKFPAKLHKEGWTWGYFIAPSLFFGFGTFFSLLLQVVYLTLEKKNVDNDDNFIFDCEQNSFKSNKDYQALLGFSIGFTVLGLILIIIPPIYCLLNRNNTKKTTEKKGEKKENDKKFERQRGQKTVDR